MFGGIFVPLMTRAMQNSPDLHPELIDNTAGQNEQALLAMTLLGAGEIMGGNLVGSVRDRAGNRAALVLELGLVVAGASSVLIFNQHNKFNYLAYLMCFVRGL